MEISEKTMAIHKDKLYAGYVVKKKEIGEKLKEYFDKGEFADANQSYSFLRGLKEGETFATNGVYLHEWYFEVLSGNGDPREAPELSRALAEKWGSMDKAIAYMSACGMAARGWAVLGWDIKEARLKQYNCDSHNQGGVWGTIPIIVLDVYEHAYFLDFGADRKAYIEAFWKAFDWKTAEENYLKIRNIKL